MFAKGSDRRGRSLSRVTIAIVLVITVVVSVYFAAPTKALDVTFPSLPASGTLGSTYSFQVKVDIADMELLPMQSVNLYIYKPDARATYEATCANLPPYTTTTPYTMITATGTSGTAGTISITAAADSTWGYIYGYGGYVTWQGGGYNFFQPSGYGYGYGYIRGGTSLTYSINWTSPSSWPAGNYKAEIKLTADGQTFTKTSSEFILSSSGIAGRVALEGRPQGPAWVIPATVQLWEVGADRTSASPIATHNVTTNNDGSFEIGISPGNYDITIKGSHTLRNLAGNVVINTGALTDVDFGTLIEGDCWGAGGVPDNIVDISDYSAILYSFGTMSGYDRWVATCDLNQDGVVDVADYSIALFNFGQTGVSP